MGRVIFILCDLDVRNAWKLPFECSLPNLPRLLQLLRARAAITRLASDLKGWRHKKHADAESHPLSIDSKWASTVHIGPTESRRFINRECNHFTEIQPIPIANRPGWSGIAISIEFPCSFKGQITACSCKLDSKSNQQSGENFIPRCFIPETVRTGTEIWIVNNRGGCDSCAPDTEYCFEQGVS